MPGDREQNQDNEHEYENIHGATSSIQVDRFPFFYYTNFDAP